MADTLITVRLDENHPAGADGVTASLDALLVERLKAGEEAA